MKKVKLNNIILVIFSLAGLTSGAKKVPEFKPGTKIFTALNGPAVESSHPWGSTSHTKPQPPIPMLAQGRQRFVQPAQLIKRQPPSKDRAVTHRAATPSSPAEESIHANDPNQSADRSSEIRTRFNDFVCSFGYHFRYFPHTTEDDVRAAYLQMSKRYRSPYYRILIRANLLPKFSDEEAKLSKEEAVFILAGIFTLCPQNPPNPIQLLKTQIEECSKIAGPSLLGFSVISKLFALNKPMSEAMSEKMRLVCMLRSQASEESEYEHYSKANIEENEPAQRLTQIIETDRNKLADVFSHEVDKIIETDRNKLADVFSHEVDKLRIELTEFNNQPRISNITEEDFLDLELIRIGVRHKGYTKLDRNFYYKLLRDGKPMSFCLKLLSLQKQEKNSAESNLSHVKAQLKEMYKRHPNEDRSRASEDQLLEGVLNGILLFHNLYDPEIKQIRTKELSYDECISRGYLSALMAMNNHKTE